MNDLNTFMFSANNSSKGLLSNSDSDSEPSSLLSNSMNNVGSILTMSNNESGMDAFGGKDLFGTTNFANFNELSFVSSNQVETVGSVAYNSAETVGSVACASMGFDGGASAGAGAGASACAGAGSCGGGSFSSVC